MGDISRNFSRWEFVCRCCKHYNMKPEMIRALQKFRDFVNAPVFILSGSRCKKHNREVSKARHSWHLKGLAADVVIVGMAPDDMAKIAMMVPEFEEGGIIIYPHRGFIHLDMRDDGPYHHTDYSTG